MFIMGNLIAALANLLSIVLWVYLWLIIIRAVMSWVEPNPYNPIVQFLYKATEPVLYPIRSRMGLYGIGVDLSPLVVILIIYFLRDFVVSTLFDLAMRMK